MDHKDLKLVPIEEEAVVVLNNVFFDFDKASLKSESYAELDRVVGLLNERNSIMIEVGGHTDSIGPDNYNLGLSERRAQSVATYLKGKGVDSSRITIKYFGESQPIEDNSTRDGRRQNRRVEFKIIKK